MRLANERHRYIVTMSLIGWAYLDLFLIPGAEGLGGNGGCVMASIYTDGALGEEYGPL